MVLYFGRFYWAEREGILWRRRRRREVKPFQNKRPNVKIHVKIILQIQIINALKFEIIIHQK